MASSLEKCTHHATGLFITLEDGVRDPPGGEAVSFAWPLRTPPGCADCPHLPEVGRFEYETFNPRIWRNNYPNPAFELHNPPATRFGGAKKAMAFSDDAIHAILSTAQYSEQRTAEWVVTCPIERRNKIGRAFFEDVLLLDSFAGSGGRSTFEDLAARYGFRESPVYSVQWFEYDNRTGARAPVSQAATFDVPGSQAPHLAATIQTGDPMKTVTVYIHDDCVVGMERTW
jgi:hypothetical protein